MKTRPLGEYDIYINDGNYGNIYPSKEYFLDSGVPFISATDFNGKVFNYDGIKHVSEELHFNLLTKGHLKINDVIIVVRGNGIGKVGFFKDEIGECNLNAQLAFIRTNPNELNSEYLYYLFSSVSYLELIKKFGSGSAQPQLPINRLKLVPVVEKDILIQEKIVKVLSDLDAKIELNNRINTELEAMAKLIYDYWFVQFDFPDKNEKPYKTSGGKMVYNKELKREIPEGWEVDSFSNWIANDKSGDWGKESKQGSYINKVSCIRGADLNGLNGKGKVKSPTRYVLEKNRHKLLEIGDFIIEISGGSPVQSTGRMAFITEETLERFDNPLICSNFCKAVTLKDEKSIYNFAYEWNRLYDAGVLFGWEGKTSGIKNLLFDSFVTNHKVVLPSKESMELFYNIAKPIHAQIQKNLQQNQKLAELRDWLLPMLMNGQVRVN